MTNRLQLVGRPARHRRARACLWLWLRSLLLVGLGLGGSFILAPPLAAWQAATRSADEPARIERSAYYRRCADARAAGAAPLRRGDPGYRAEMDADGDGVACEPYRGRSGRAGYRTRRRRG